ncbi:MAG TPA: tetratricopeptide repeat protein, partial [Candidatus Obscuribacterales bacterium]|nr:tetratricopeptide repeat protein [Candidatus Obscuribacterales bacterium]
MARGDFQAAIVQFNIALKENPNQADLISERAGCYLFLTKWDKAKADIAQALKLNPNLASA